jgi:5-methylcytosine-specific restriction endonuclease McrA
LPESPEVDEIIPVSKGGDPYDRKNCRLTHRLCNQQRGNGDRPMKLSEPTLKTSRKW